MELFTLPVKEYFLPPVAVGIRTHLTPDLLISSPVIKKLAYQQTAGLQVPSTGRVSGLPHGGKPAVGIWHTAHSQYMLIPKTNGISEVSQLPYTLQQADHTEGLNVR